MKNILITFCFLCLILCGCITKTSKNYDKQYEYGISVVTKNPRFIYSAQNNDYYIIVEEDNLNNISTIAYISLSNKFGEDFIEKIITEHHIPYKQDKPIFSYKNEDYYPFVSSNKSIIALVNTNYKEIIVYKK